MEVSSRQIFSLGLQREGWTRGEVSGSISTKVNETAEKSICSKVIREPRQESWAIQSLRVL